MNRYQDIQVTKNLMGKRMYVGIKYPDVPVSPNDSYVLCGDTDRYDKLALDYYQDKSLWWVISIANNASTQTSLFPPTDVYIRIPANPLEVVARFNSLNSGLISFVDETNIQPNTTSPTNGTGGGTGGSGGGSGGGGY